jgi:hypothetical protein
MTTNSELTYADLEIRILKREETGYSVEITLNPDQYYQRGFLGPDLPSEDGAHQMGARMAAWFFDDATLKAAWAYARGRCPRRRIRLCLDEDVPELHVLPWEALRDPENGLDLAAVDATPFSRFLAGEWQGYDPVSTRPIKILVVIANPDDLSRYNLAVLDVEAEWAMLRKATEGLDVTLTRLPPPCTLTAIERELRQGYHVLHIIAHGAYSERRGQAALYLVDAENHGQIVREDAFAGMLARQLSDAGAQNPDYLRLVFLASCQSATRNTADAFRGLAPALVNAHVPAVVAMQDTVSIMGARAFSHIFYERLLQHGLVDLAGNQARATLLTGGSSEAVTPVIFRRGSGKLFDSLAKGQQPIEPEAEFLRHEKGHSKKDLRKAVVSNNILRLLYETHRTSNFDQLGFTTLVKRLGISRESAHSHLRELIEKGYVKRETKALGARIFDYYSITQEGIEILGDKF